MLAKQLEYLSVLNYLAAERLSTEKYEYVAGQVYAMAGAKINHNRITRNLANLFWSALQDQPCEPFVSDMLIKTAHDRFRYPDVVVVCNDDPSQDDYVREHPILVVEVIAESTRRTDKTDKRLEYIALPSLLEYVLVEQPFYYYLGQEVMLESINTMLKVEDIYERVENGELAKWRLEKSAREAQS